MLYTTIHLTIKIVLVSIVGGWIIILAVVVVATVVRDSNTSCHNLSM